MNASHNSLCRDVGQRRVDGTWKEITPSRSRGQSSPEQSLLWDEQTLLAQGLHPRQREIERRAEQRYQFFTRL